MIYRKSLHTLGISIFLFSFTISIATGQEINVDSFLKKWESATQERKSLDARLQVLKYDYVFHDKQPISKEARLYYESPGTAYFENLADDNIFIWRENETLWITPSSKSYVKASLAELNNLLENKATSWFDPSYFVSVLHRPQALLPFMLRIDADDVQNRFELSVEKADNGYLVIATPKLSTNQLPFREIHALVSPDTFLTEAIQLISSGGNHKDVYIIASQVKNQTPADRQHLLAPDLSNYRLKK